MDARVYEAFYSELAKTAGLGDLWNRFVDLFRGEDAKTERRVNYLFSERAGPEKWNRFAKHVKSPEYLAAVSKHEMADPTLVQHARSMHELSNGKALGVVQSTRLPGQSYEIRKLESGRLGCTCPDWRFKGTVSQHDCKHVKAFKAGKVRAE